MTTLTPARLKKVPHQLFHNQNSLLLPRSNLPYVSMIHSNRVRTELFFPAVAVLSLALGVEIPLRKLPSSSKNNCSSTSATPMPSFPPPATHSFRPRLRCERANETARGRILCTNVCSPRFPKGRCIRSTRDVPLFSPRSSSAFAQVSLSSGRGSIGEGLSVSPGVTFDAYTTMNAVSVPPSLSGPHVLGTLAGSSRGRSPSVQSSTQPRTFSTGVGNVLHAPPCSPSTPEV